MTLMNRPVGILGTGSYAPERIISNKDLEKIVDTSDEWIRERTGIEQRHIISDEMNTSDLATEAAKRALEAAQVKAEDIDLIIVATVTPDVTFPAVSCIVQSNIGAVNAAAFDLSAGCSGFVYSSITAASYIATGMYEKVLVIGAEALSRVVNWKDRNTCILFGDAAGAAVYGVVEEGHGILGFDMGADGSGGMNLTIPASGVAMAATDEAREEGQTYIHMNGQEVYKFAVKTMGSTVVNALERANLTVDDLDFFIPHQANKRIIDSAAKRLKLPAEKVFINLPKYGNTSGASIPLALDEAIRANKIKKGDIVALSGFGAGLTWAGMIMKWC